jgi:hypothetical protein
VRLLPRPNLVLVIERHPLRIQEQRADALLDRHFHRRRALYRRIAARFALPVVDNNGPVVRTLETTLALIHECRTAEPGLQGSSWPERQTR